MTEALSPEAFARNCASLSAFLFLVWDTFSTFDHEYKFIWKGQLTWTRGFYFFCRYVALVVQACDLIISTTFISRGPVAASSCRAWMIFQSICYQSFFTAMNYLLMLRVYALYNQAFRIGVLLGIVLLSDTGLASVSLLLMIWDSEFDPTCIVKGGGSRCAILFGFVVLITQCLIWSMTLWKRGRTARDVRIRIPLIDLLVRDGSIIFVGAAAIVIICVPYSVALQALPHITVSWCITLLSVTACRLIINPLLLTANESVVESQDITGFTSCEDLALEHLPAPAS